MANPVEGILGGFSGKVGTVVGAKWKGKQVMKRKPVVSKNRKLSEAQVIQQAKFRLANKFFKRFTRLFRVSFEDMIGQTQRGTAFRTLLTEAIVGTYPAFTVDYSKVLVAKGNLEQAVNPAVVSNAPGMLDFTWTDSSADTDADPHDVAILVAYCEELNMLIYTVNGPKRLAETADLSVPYFSGKQVQTWIAFRSADSRSAADSIYTGAVLVS
jgi:hypothetical protein